MKYTIQESVIDFKLSGKPKQFKVYNNLHTLGLDVLSAFENWAVRTKNYTEKSFCDYVKSKDPANIICLTEVEYIKLSN